MTNVPPEAQTNDAFDYEHNPTWRIFRIMSEFVEGFTFLARVQHSVTFFGLVRLPTTHPCYQLARQLGQRLAHQGYAIRPCASVPRRASPCASLTMPTNLRRLYTGAS